MRRPTTDAVRQALPFHEPSVPDAHPILELHRGHDGHVAFARKDKMQAFEHLCAVPAVDLKGAFHQILPSIVHDGYFGVNGYFRDAGTPSPIIPTLALPFRRGDAVRWLTACYVDLDCYAVGLTVGATIGNLINLQDNEVIPPVSLLFRSGRGVWAFWLLHEGNDVTSPARAWPEAVMAYQAIQRRLHEITAVLGSDANARDVARVARVPGSLNRKAGERVSYFLQADASGRPYSYTLDDLMIRLTVACPALPRRRRGDGAPNANKRRGWLALQEKRLANLMQLECLRGGFPEGCRARACLLHASFMRHLGYSPDEVERSTLALGRRCRPPLPDREIRGAVQRAPTIHRITDQKISNWLDVTPAEAALLDRCPPASQFGGASSLTRPETLTRPQRRDARRLAIRSLIGAGNAPVPTLVELRAKLDEFNLGASIETIRADLVDMGVVNPRSR